MCSFVFVQEEKATPLYVRCAAAYRIELGGGPSESSSFVVVVVPLLYYSVLQEESAPFQETTHTHNVQYNERGEEKRERGRESALLALLCVRVFVLRLPVQSAVRIDPGN